MKLMLKKKMGVSKLRHAVRANTAGLSTAPTIGKKNVDRYVQYVGTRVAVAVIADKVGRMPVPSALKHEGYLLVKGNKPGLLVHPVKYDGDIYKRDNIFGSVAELNKVKGMSAEIVSKTELIARAKKFNKSIEVTRLSDGKRIKVALLNGFGEQYVAGLNMSEHRVENMEHVETHNKKAVQYEGHKDILALPVSKF